MGIHLFPISLYGLDRLHQIILPEEQLQYVRFTSAAARFYQRFGFTDTELGMAEAGCKLMTLSLR